MGEIHRQAEYAIAQDRQRDRPVEGLGDRAPSIGSAAQFHARSCRRKWMAEVWPMGGDGASSRSTNGVFRPVGAASAAMLLLWGAKTEASRLKSLLQVLGGWRRIALAHGVEGERGQLAQAWTVGVGEQGFQAGAGIVLVERVAFGQRGGKRAAHRVENQRVGESVQHAAPQRAQAGK